MSQSRTIIFGRRSTAQLLFALGMSLIVVFSLVPAVGILVVSFTDIRSLPFLPVHFIGLENYATFFSSAQLGYNLHALKNTLFFAVAVTLVAERHRPVHRRAAQPCGCAAGTSPEQSSSCRRSWA